MRALEEFAVTYRSDEIAVRRAVVALDVQRDGEPVTRVTLLVNDPAAETWGLKQVWDLEEALARRAVALDLPWVSITLVPDSEAELVEAFAR